VRDFDPGYVSSGSKRDPLLSARMSASASCGHQHTRGQASETRKSAAWVGLDIEGGEGKSVWMVSLLRRTAHLQHRFVVVKGTYVYACDALWVSVSQRSHNLFLAPLRYLPPGDGRADRGKTQNSNSQKFEISKIANRKNQNLENFHHKVFREIDREIVFRKTASLSQDQRQDFRFFVSLSSIRNVRRAYLMRASSVPMKRRHLPG
jgi:hypothetical protein